MINFDFISYALSKKVLYIFDSFRLSYYIFMKLLFQANRMLPENFDQNQSLTYKIFI